MDMSMIFQSNIIALMLMKSHDKKQCLGLLQKCLLDNETLAHYEVLASHQAGV